MQSTDISLKFNKLKTCTEFDNWTAVAKGSVVGVWEHVGYVAKLDAVQSHGSKRTTFTVRRNSWWVASLKPDLKDALPEVGCTEGIGKYTTRREAADRLLSTR